MEGAIDPDAELDACEYCGTALHMDTDDWVFVEVSWGSATAHGLGSLTFCTQEHAATYLAENTLPEPSRPVELPLDLPPRRLTLRGVGAAILVLLNAAIYLLGFVTWLRWVWA